MALWNPSSGRFAAIFSRKGGSKGDHVDWAAVRAAYEAGAETIAAVRARFGVGRDQLRARRDAEGWRRRPTDAGGLARLRREQRLARAAAELAAAEAAEAPVDWQEVRRLYEAGEVPVGEIRRRFALSVRQLRQAREQGGWAARPQVATPGPRRGGKGQLTSRLAARLGRALQAETARFERAALVRAASGAPPGPGDARGLAELVRAAERLKRLERTEKAPAEAAARRRGGDAHGETARHPASAEEYDPAHVEWMRQELKRRLRILAGDPVPGREEEEDGAAAAGEAQ